MDLYYFWTISHVTLVVLLGRVVAINPNEELACNDDLAEALGVTGKDHLLYGLTADCDLFFARNPPPGTDLNAVFGSKEQFSSEKENEHKYDMYFCNRAVMMPIKDTAGKLKLLVIGPILYEEDTSMEESVYHQWFAYVYDFKKPPKDGREWYVTTKMITCGERDRLAALAKNETEQLRYWPMMPIGVDCQFDQDFTIDASIDVYQGLEAARSFFVNDFKLFYAYKSWKYLDTYLDLENDDRLMYVKEYHLNGTNNALWDGVDKGAWRFDYKHHPREKWAFWKLIKKPWDKYAFGSDLLEVRLDQGAQKLYLIGDEGMKVVDFTPETLQNKNLFYASQLGGVIFEKTGIRNTTPKVGEENWRVRQRQIVNEKMIIHYDRFHLTGKEELFHRHRSNETTEIVVLPMGKAMTPEEFGKGAKCIGRLVQPSKEKEEDLMARAKKQRRTEAKYSKQENFQINMLEQKLYDLL